MKFEEKKRFGKRVLSPRCFNLKVLWIASKFWSSQRSSKRFLIHRTFFIEIICVSWSKRWTKIDNLLCSTVSHLLWWRFHWATIRGSSLLRGLRGKTLLSPVTAFLLHPWEPPLWVMFPFEKRVSSGWNSCLTPHIYELIPWI